MLIYSKSSCFPLLEKVNQRVYLDGLFVVLYMNFIIIITFIGIHFKIRTISNRAKVYFFFSFNAFLGSTLQADSKPIESNVSKIEIFQAFFILYPQNINVPFLLCAFLKILVLILEKHPLLGNCFL